MPQLLEETLWIVILVVILPSILFLIDGHGRLRSLLSYWWALPRLPFRWWGIDLLEPTADPEQAEVDWKSLREDWNEVEQLKSDREALANYLRERFNSIPRHHSVLDQWDNHRSKTLRDRSHVPFSAPLSPGEKHSLDVHDDGIWMEQMVEFIIDPLPRSAKINTGLGVIAFAVVSAMLFLAVQSGWLPLWTSVGSFFVFILGLMLLQYVLYRPGVYVRHANPVSQTETAPTARSSMDDDSKKSDHHVLSVKHGHAHIEILPPEVPSTFDAGRIKSDLERIASTPGVWQTYIERARSRFTKKSEMAILEQYIRLYGTGTRTVKSKTELERAQSEYRQLGYEDEKKQKEKEAAIAKLDADIEEERLRKDHAAAKRRRVQNEAENFENAEPSEDQRQFDAGVDERRLHKRWEIHEAMGKVTTLRELHRWKKDQRGKIIHDRGLTETEKVEELEFVDSEYEAFRRQLDRDTAIFEDK